MNTDTLADFLATDLNGAFEFMRRLNNDGGPSRSFLEELKHALPSFSLAKCEAEGTAEWAHLVAGLMIAGDWDPDGFAAIAAPFLASQGTAVWCAAHNLLLGVSRLDRPTFDSVVTHAPKCPHNCDDLLAQLRDRLAH